MDNTFYIKLGSIYWFVQAIPESITGDAVTVAIKRLSDGYTWNFSTLAFVSGSQSGNMIFISDILWKQSFTPPTEDTYIVTINDETLDVKYVQVLKAIGEVTQAEIAGVGSGSVNTLIELDDVKRYLNLTTEDDDVLLSDIIKRKDAHVKKYCDRTFIQATFTEYYKGDGTDRLMLREYPVASITSLYIDEDRVWGADSIIDSDDYIISDEVEGLIIYVDGSFPETNMENIKVIYTAGYIASEIPEDLKEAVIKLVVAEYLSAKTGINAFKTEEGTTRQETLTKEAYEVLDTYRKVR